MKTIQLKVPYQLRHLCPDIKQAGGRFDSTTKIWSVPESPESKRLATIIAKPVEGQTPEEKVKNVVTMTIELLNTIGTRKFFLVESGSKILIESETLPQKK